MSPVPDIELLKSLWIEILVMCLCRLSGREKEGEEVRGREGWREGKKRARIFHLLIHSMIVHNSQGWASLKLGACDSIQASHMHGRDTGT